MGTNDRDPNWSPRHEFDTSRPLTPKGWVDQLAPAVRQRLADAARRGDRTYVAQRMPDDLDLDAVLAHLQEA
jgi:hypothetical protein